MGARKPDVFFYFLFFGGYVADFIGIQTNIPQFIFLFRNAGLLFNSWCFNWHWMTIWRSVKGINNLNCRRTDQPSILGGFAKKGWRWWRLLGRGSQRKWSEKRGKVKRTLWEMERKKIDGRKEERKETSHYPIKLEHVNDQWNRVCQMTPEGNGWISTILKTAN